MRDFGLKHTARQLAEASSTPLLPGTGLLDDVQHALREAAAPFVHTDVPGELPEADGPGTEPEHLEAVGFLLDRGFQVLQTAYPEARRELDYGELGLVLLGERGELRSPEVPGTGYQGGPELPRWQDRASPAAGSGRWTDCEPATPMPTRSMRIP